MKFKEMLKYYKEHLEEYPGSGAFSSPYFCTLHQHYEALLKVAECILTINENNERIIAKYEELIDDAVAVVHADQTDKDWTLDEIVAREG